MFPINQTCHNLMESVNDDPLAYILNEEKEEKESTNKIKLILKTWAKIESEFVYHAEDICRYKKYSINL